MSFIINSYVHSTARMWSQIGSDLTGTGVSDGAGVSVALNDTGNIMAYASPYNTDGGADSGEIRVFENVAGTWTQVGSDIEGAPGDLATRPGLGTHCVSLNGAGDVLATSWPGSDDVSLNLYNDAGQVRVYKNVSNTWTLTGGEINAVTSDTRLGAYDGLSLNTEGNVVAVGGWLGGDQPGVSDPGIVRVYEMVAGNWSQIGQTLSGETTGVPGDYNENADYFGYSVSLNGAGDVIIVGGYANDNNDYPNLAAAGHARVFENISGTWTQIGSDIDGESAGLTLGRSTSINNTGNIVAVGGSGSGAEVGTETGVVRIFENVAGTWTQIGSDITGVTINDRVGYSLELNGAGDIIAIGDVIHDSTNTTNIGRMRIFKNIEGEWVQHAADIAGSAENEYTGWSVALNNLGDVAAVGSPGYVTPGDTITYPGRGRVRVYIDPASLTVFYDVNNNELVGRSITTDIPAGFTAAGQNLDIFYITIGASCTSVGENAFNGSALKGDLIIPSTVTDLYNNCFRNCNALTSLTLNEGLININEGAFAQNEQFTNTVITIPNSVETIGVGAFFQCTSLTSITVGTGVQTIGPVAFSGCSNLTTFNCYVSKTIVDAATSMLEQCTSLTEIHVRSTDSSWTAGADQTIGGKTGITVIKDLPG